MGRKFAYSGIQAGAWVERQRSPAVLFLGKSAEAGRAPSQNHGGVGRSAAARHTEGCSDPVLARTNSLGSGRATGEPRSAFDWLLHRPEPVRRPALSCRSVRRRGSFADTGTEGANTWRRSGDVE